MRIRQFLLSLTQTHLDTYQWGITTTLSKRFAISADKCICYVKIEIVIAQSKYFSMGKDVVNAALCLHLFSLCGRVRKGHTPWFQRRRYSKLRAEL